jgi:hypothetical protein
MGLFLGISPASMKKPGARTSAQNDDKGAMRIAYTR